MKGTLSQLLLTSLLAVTSAQEGDQTLDPTGRYSIVPKLPPPGTSRSISPDFLSFSIEFSSFPAYAGNKSYPNTFSRTLLNNIAQAQGARPVIRVGGESQDRALLAGYIDTPFNESFVPASEDDILPFGRPFFESYATFPGTRYIHGLNLARSNDGYRRNLRGAIIMACQVLRGGAAMSWELGNEPDMYGSVTGIDAQGKRQVLRVGTWNDAMYVREWMEVERDLRKELSYSCPEMTSASQWRMVGPSFSGRSGGMDVWSAWEGGLKQEGVINEFSSHFYAVDANNAQFSPQAIISSHSQLKTALQPQIQLAQRVVSSGMPFILDEANFARQRGIANLSDTFASALWTLNFALYAAVNNITRIHLHQGVDFPGSAWQPLDTKQGKKGVKPAYYGAIAAAAMVSKGVRVVQLDTSKAERPNVVAYAAYDGSRLKRVMLINLAPQELEHFFAGPLECFGYGTVRRLAAPSVTSMSGVTWSGEEYGPDGVARNITGSSGEKTDVGKFGSFRVQMPAAGAVMVELNCADMPRWDQISQ